jgi:hypothetical protein
MSAVEQGTGPLAGKACIAGRTAALSMYLTGPTLMERPRRPSRPDAGQGPGSPADDGIDRHPDGLAQTESCTGPGSSQPVPARCPDEPDECDSESTLRLHDLEIDYPAKSPREKSDYTGRRLPPHDVPWDFNPTPQYFLVACYLIIMLIVLAGLLLINARGAGPSSAVAENQALVSIRFPSPRVTLLSPRRAYPVFHGGWEVDE